VAGFELEARAFAPHVTLLRNAARPPRDPARERLQWPVASFVLVASERDAKGAQYRVLGRWPLGGGRSGSGGRGWKTGP